jgi:hypothetical protein
MEERPQSISPIPPNVNNDPIAPHPSPLPQPVDAAAAKDISLTADAPSPTQQQRLEFLRYLVSRGLVNEGHEEK